MVGRAFTGIIAAVVALAANPAWAEGIDWGAAKADFRSGASSGITPQTSGEAAMCGGYWFLWGDALSDGAVPDAQMALIDPAFDMNSAALTAMHWIEKAGGRDRIRKHSDAAERKLRMALGGDGDARRAFFETLGTCRKP